MKSIFPETSYELSAGGVIDVICEGVESTKTLVITGGVNAKSKSCKEAFLIVPAFNSRGDKAWIPSISNRLDSTIYRKVNAVVPVPEK